MTFYAPQSNMSALGVILSRVMRRKKGLVLASCAAIAIVGYGGAQVVARSWGAELEPLRTKAVAQRTPYAERALNMNLVGRGSVAPQAGSVEMASLPSAASDFDPPWSNRFREAEELAVLEDGHDHEHEHGHDDAYAYDDTFFHEEHGPDSEFLNETSFDIEQTAGALGQLHHQLNDVLSDPTVTPGNVVGYTRHEITVDEVTQLKALLLAHEVDEVDADAAAAALPTMLAVGDVVDVRFAPAAFRFDLREQTGLGRQAVYRIGVTEASGAKSHMLWPMTTAFSDADPDVEVVRLSPEETRARLLEMREEARRRAIELDGPVLVQGVIHSSLYVSAQDAGLTNNQISQLTQIYAPLVDFGREIRRGDAFKVVFHRDWKEDGSYEDGAIEYASLTNRGQTLQLFRFESDNVSGYYDEEGREAQSSFLRHPLQNARISSGYGMRLHPIHNRRKMHYGIDFAAPRGTPIESAGNGIVRFVGRKGGYGNYILIRHNRTYSTAYAHMSRFASGITVGTRVRQGQVIGYVGSTGASTGNHLHYEVIENGRKINPRNASRFDPVPLNARDQREFELARDQMLTRLERLQEDAETQFVADVR